MNLLQKTLIKLRLRRISQQDVNEVTRLKDIKLLQLVLRFGTYTQRASAVATLGRLKAMKAVPILIPLLWDDFKTVALAAKKTLSCFLPNAQIELHLHNAEAYWNSGAGGNKRKVYWFNTNNPLEPPAPLVDKSKMKLLAKGKIQLQKPIRFW